MVDRYYRKIESVENEIDNSIQISSILLKLKEYDEKLSDLSKIENNQQSINNNEKSLDNNKNDISNNKKSIDNNRNNISNILNSIDNNINNISNNKKM